MSNKIQQDEMLELNRNQASFYDTQKKSGFTLFWSRLRGRLDQYRTEVGVKEAIYDLHRSWLGDLSNKSVLDLGCGRGNRLMYEMAQHSKSYLAIDISAEAIAEVRRKLDEQHLEHARAEVADFLSPDFTEKFDVIYAYGVLHHFRYFDTFLEKLASHLNPGGMIVSHDPMNTALLPRIFRAVYRPFQADREWEWPFSKQSFASIQAHFHLEKVCGVLGASKWAFPYYLLAPQAALSSAKKAHQRDMQEATALNDALFRCLQVSLLLRKREK